MKINNNSKGKGYWKLNAQILKDTEYKEGIRSILNDINGELNRIESARIKWELIKCRIKQFTIFACKQRSDEQAKRRIMLQNKIDTLTAELESDWSDEKQQEITAASVTLRDLYTEKTNGAYIRSKVKFIEKEESSQAYFVKMEKSRQTYNTIKSLRNEDNHIVYDDIKILDIARDFYTKLYSSNNTTVEDIRGYLNTIEIPKLSEKYREDLDQPIQMEELNYAVKKLKYNKSPGADGITPEFYKCFWDELKYYFIDMINEVFTMGELPPSCKRSILSLMYKKNDRNDMKNYRPISLTNCDYKIIGQ